VNAFERHRAAAAERLRASGLAQAGAGSVTWRIHRERIVIAGWGRAILLQLAHPSIAAGLDEHSSFRGSLASGVRRLQTTVGAMLSITFGDSKEMIAAAARINAVHDRVRGPSYSAHDPVLQQWVHATLIDSIRFAFQLLVGPLTAAERDAYCREAAIMEPLLGMPAGFLPRDAAELDRFVRDTLAGNTLVVTDRSRALARAVLFPPRWPAAWPAFRAFQLITIGSLPPSLREAYGFDWGASDERAYARWSATLRRSVAMLPAAVRYWPIARRPAAELARSAAA
jgi:uncharacterized protein (DUF2236 family)